MLENIRQCLFGNMKTDFNFLWPYANFKTSAEDLTWWTVGFQTQFSYMKHDSGEWNFEIQVLGFGFYIERYPV